MANNIIDTFKKCCTVFLAEDRGVYIPDCPDPIIVLPQVEIVQFDLVGFVVDFEGEVMFIPWGNVTCIKPDMGGVTINESK
jgi:hypothetical protein